jgi:neuroligin
MVSPVAKGLFHRAILLSGSALSDWALSNHHEQITLQVAQGVNCPLTYEGDRLLNCLKNRSYTDMINVRISTPKFSTPFGPIVDGMVIPDDPQKLMGQSSELFNR